MKMTSSVAAAAAVAAAVIFLPAPAAADEAVYYGLLRSRDLTPFGFLRLDMRPAYAIAIEPRSWAFEAELGFQNTWALSPEVENYLVSLEEEGRRELGPDDAQAIQALPGENYLVDMESALLDLTLHYKFTETLTGYLTAGAVSYHGGFLDGMIEEFHDAFGFSSFGRPAAARNDVNVIYDLNALQLTFFDAPTSGGFTDPTIGLRYAGPPLSGKWQVTLEAAVKLPVAGRRDFLSTGRTDYGVQASFQRFGDHHAWYAEGAAAVGEHQPQPAGVRERERLHAPHDRPRRTARAQVPAQHWSPSPHPEHAAVVRLHRERPELQQHARHRFSPRLRLRSASAAA